MLDWLYEALGTMLYWFSELFGGYYVFALLIYALLFKLLFLPFAVKQQQNQIKMAKLAPQIELIKAKYKGRTDQATLQKQQQEILEFQQKEGYNPMGGCLPMLIQFPIIIFLYNVIRNPLSHICNLADEKVIEIYNTINYNNTVDVIKGIDQIKLVGQIKDYLSENPEAFASYDLSKLPNFELFGANLGNVPSLQNLSWIVLVPVIELDFRFFTLHRSLSLS